MSESENIPAVQAMTNTVKIPDFWADDATVWFQQVDSQFRLSKITSEQTRFDYVIQKLDKVTVKRVRDLIANPPERNQYTTLKERILACFKKDEYEELLDFQMQPTLGDRRPSELMDDLMSSIPSLDQTGAALPFLRFAFLFRLPDNLRQLVSTHEPNETLRSLAGRTDRLWKAAGGANGNFGSANGNFVRGNSPFVNAIPGEHDNADYNTEASVSAMRRPAGQQFTGRGGYKQQQNDKQHAVHLCYKHFRFGDQAFNCDKQCRERGCSSRCEKLTGNGQAGGRRN